MYVRFLMALLSLFLGGNHVLLCAANEAPQFVAGPDVEANEDGGPQTVGGWATGIVAGPSAESWQRVRFELTNKDSTLFAVQPAIDPDGTLTFTPAHGAFGRAVVTVIAIDDGGIEEGGWDTSEALEFVITIQPVNDPPLFEIQSSPEVFQDAGAVTLNNWAFRFNPGSQFEVGQILEFDVVNDQPALFIQQPSVDASGTLTFEPAPGARGTASLSVVARDNGGTERGGVDRSKPVSFTITILPVNRPPHAGIAVIPTSWLSRSATDVVVIGNSHGMAKVRFDSSESDDPDGDEIARRWWLGGGLLVETNPVVTLNLDEGRYDVTVAITDGSTEELATVSVEIIEPGAALEELTTEVSEHIANRGLRRRMLALLRQADRELRRRRVELAEAALLRFERETKHRFAIGEEMLAHSREIRAAIHHSRRW